MNRQWVRVTLFVGYCLLSFLAVGAIDWFHSPAVAVAAAIGCAVAGPFCLALDYRLFREVRTGALLPGVAALGMWACYAFWPFLFAFAIWYYGLFDRVVNFLR
jgi:hypothetical protein